MRIVHYKSVAVKLVIQAMLAKSGGFKRHADFHTLYHAWRGHFVHSTGTDGIQWMSWRWHRTADASSHFVHTSTMQTGRNGHLSSTLDAPSR
jgi:hypothetical protein